MHTEVPIFYKVSENFVFRKKIPNKQDTPPTFQVQYYTTYESSKLHIFFLSSYFLNQDFFFQKDIFTFFSTCVRDNAPNYQQQISSLDVTFGIRVDPHHNHIMGPNRLFTTSLKADLCSLLKNELLEKFSQYLIQFIMLPYLFFDQI